MSGPGDRVAIGLLHHPVYDKQHRLVTTAVTNLDVHDLARSACTFGLHRYYVVTPVAAQQELVNRILRHWRQGWGSEYNPKRRAALELVSVSASLDAALDDLAGHFGQRPRLLVTGARSAQPTLGYGEFRERLAADTAPWLLLFGTGWGLSDEVFARADAVLAPIVGAGDYNHLSVRAAAAIILDRLFGRSAD